MTTTPNLLMLHTSHGMRWLVLNFYFVKRKLQNENCNEVGNSKR